MGVIGDKKKRISVLTDITLSSLYSRIVQELGIREYGVFVCTVQDALDPCENFKLRLLDEPDWKDVTKVVCRAFSEQRDVEVQLHRDCTDVTEKGEKDQVEVSRIRQKSL